MGQTGVLSNSQRVEKYFSTGWELENCTEKKSQMYPMTLWYYWLYHNRSLDSESFSLDGRQMACRFVAGVAGFGKTNRQVRFANGSLHSVSWPLVQSVHQAVKFTFMLFMTSRPLSVRFPAYSVRWWSCCGPLRLWKPTAIKPTVV